MLDHEFMFTVNTYVTARAYRSRGDAPAPQLKIVDSSRGFRTFAQIMLMIITTCYFHALPLERFTMTSQASLPTLEKLGSKVPCQRGHEGSSPGFFRVIVSGHVDRIVIEDAYFEIFRALTWDFGTFEMGWVPVVQAP